MTLRASGVLDGMCLDFKTTDEHPLPGHQSAAPHQLAASPMRSAADRDGLQDVSGRHEEFFWEL